MVSTSAVIEEAILDILESRESLSIEQMVCSLPWISRREVFLAVEVLSRKGAIVLKLEGFSYEVAPGVKGLSVESQPGAGI